jgi:hypothetical protein
MTSSKALRPQAKASAPTILCQITRADDSVVWQDFLRSFADIALSLLPTFNSQELGNTINGFARLVGPLSPLCSAI